MTKIKPNSGANENLAPVFLEPHRIACENKLDSYIDPETSFHVLTSYYLKSVGFCCTNKCRHCPYGFHENAWPHPLKKDTPENG